MSSRVSSPEVEYLEKLLRRPLYNIEEYGFLYEAPIFPPTLESNDPNGRLLESLYRKCYRLDEAGRIVALNLWNCRVRDFAFLGELKNLRFLSLATNHISDLSALKALPQLRSLDLGNNDIGNLSGLNALPQLQSLSLWGNQISDLSALKALPQLQSLSVGSNQISDLSALTALPRLQSLNFWGNQISDLSALTALAQLRSLDVGSNPITDLSALTALPQLHSLHFWETQISDLSALAALPQLQSLNFWSCQISDLSALTALPQLQSLYLWRNGISDLSPLVALRQLKSLSIGNNQISDLSALKDLPELQSLDLGSNQISDPSALAALPRLQSVSLWANQISDLCALTALPELQSLNVNSNLISDLSALTALPRLRSLFLGSNQISDLSALAALPQLQSVSLWKNLISDLSALEALPELQWLNVNGNQIRDIQVLATMRKLRSVDLRKNQITKLIPNVLDLRLELEEGSEQEYEMGPGSLLWRGNPIESPDPEILKRGHAAVEDYFRSLQVGGRQPLREAKVLVVGEAEVGKTSLIKQLLGLPFDKGESKTHDIGRHHLRLVCGSKGMIDLRIWDFGGQEIMHATHQFFLTRRSVYLLVLNSRHNETQCRIEYWLRLISSFGADAPVIVVCNKCDEEAMDLAWSALQGKFPQVRHFVKRVSCYMDVDSGEDKREGLKELRARIAEVIERDLPEVGKAMPAPWFEVKAELERLAERGTDYLSLERYQAICGSKKVAPGTEATLLNFLHDLGVVLHFGEGHPLVPQGNPLLDDMNVLTPAWVTAGIYKVMNDKGLMLEHRGVLTRANLRELLTAVDGRKYAGKEAYILEMMQRFELCFAIPDSAGDVLIPDLLPKEGPDTGEWKNALRFRYQYSVLPQSVIGRFIVRMHQHVSNKTYWRHGVVLKHEGIRALVQADLEAATIDIHLLDTSEGTAKGRRAFLSAIRMEFGRIHRTFSDKLSERELVPDPEHPKVFESYAKLVEMEDAGETRVWIEGVGHRPISVLLDGVSTREERLSRRDPRETIPRSAEEVQGLENAKPAATPLASPAEPDPLPWWGWSLVYGAGAMVATMLLYWVPWMWLKTCIAIGVGVTVFMLFRNPETFWRRTFGVVVTAVLGWHLLGSFFKGRWTDGAGNWLIAWNSDLGWPTAIILIVSLIGCLVGDWVQRRRN